MGDKTNITPVTAEKPGEGGSSLPDLETVIQSARTQDSSADTIPVTTLSQATATAPTSVNMAANTAKTANSKPFFKNKLFIGGTALAIALLLGFGFWYLKHHKPANNQSQASLSDKYAPTSAPLNDLASQGVGTLPVTSDTTAQLTVNGALRVNGSLVITPTAAPARASKGQLYTNKSSGALYYFDGSTWIDISTAASASVTSFQGQSGAVSLAAGTGIGINGTTITNNGVISLTSGTASLLITSDGKGGYTLVDNSMATGSVQLQPTSPGTAQTGNINITGTVVAANFSGDGSGLTNLTATNLVGIVPDGNLSSQITKQGNTFNGPGLLVQLNSSGQLPAISGVLLTNLDANNIASGKVADNFLNDTVTKKGNNFNNASQLLELDASGFLPALNGSALLALDAGHITIGTLADARLSTNVALLNRSPQTFTGSNTFTQAINVNAITPSSSLTVGAVGQSFVLQGSGTSTITSKTGAFTTTVGFNGIPVGNLNYNFDNTAIPGTYTICTSANNCSGSGTGITGGGTAGKLAVFTGASGIGNSAISDDGTKVIVQYGTDSPNAFQIQNHDASSNLFIADTQNTRIGIGKTAPAYTLDVNGDINSATGLFVGGQQVCTVSGCLADGTGGNFILNSTTLQSGGANFNFQSKLPGSVGGVIVGASGQTADLLDLKQGATLVAKFDPSGNVDIVGNYKINGTQIASTNLGDTTNIARLNADQTFTGANTFTGVVIQQATATPAFKIQDNSVVPNTLFYADTSNMRVGIGTATPGNYALDVVGSINISGTYKVNGSPICDGITLFCAPSQHSAFYINNDITQQTDANFNIISKNTNSVVAILSGKSGQTADTLQLQDGGGFKVAGFSNEGVLTLGSDAPLGTQPGSIVFNDSTANNGFNSTLGTLTLTGNRAINLPNSGGTLCVDAVIGNNNCGYALANGGTGTYIKNGTTQQIGSNFNIDGTGVAGVALQAPLFDTSTAASLNIGTTNATGINLNKDTSVSGSHTLSVGGAITGSSTIQGTSVNGTTGINTGAAGGTQRIDASGNLLNIGTISSGLINGQTVSSSANFTGTLAVASTINSQTIGSAANFTGTVQAATSFMAPLFDTASAAVLNIGTNNATNINLNKNITIGGATLNTACTYTDFAANGSLNTSLKTPDTCTYFTISQSTAGKTITVPAPTTTTAGRVIYVSNIGSVAFTLAPNGGASVPLNPGVTSTLLWNGTAWTYSGSDSSGLQTAYNNSVGGSTPEILLNSTQGGLDIQDAASTIGAGLLTVKGSGGTNTIFSVGSTGSVSLNGGAATYNVTSGYSFATHVDYSLGASQNPMSSVSGDFNGDGRPDIATANSTAGRVSILLNNGDGTFTLGTPLTASTTTTYLTTGDFNRDGKLDIAVTNSGSTTSGVMVFMGNNDGTFAAGVSYTTLATPRGIASADFNGDGWPDLVVADGTKLSYYANNQDGTFAVKLDTTAGTTPTGITAGDFNKDGKQDVAITNAGANTMSIFIGSGGGGFAAKVDYSTGASSFPGPITTGYFDGDNKLDIAVSVFGTFEVFINNGNGTYLTTGAPFYAPNGIFGAAGITVGDFNGDGKSDIATNSLSGSNYGISRFLNNGDGTFGTPTYYTNGSNVSGASSVVSGLFNADAIPDIASVGPTTSNINVFLGTASTAIVKNSLSVAPISASDGGLYVQGLTGQTADLLHVVDVNGLTNLAVSGTSGSATFKNSTDDTAAFRVQNAAGMNIFTVDTLNSKIGTTNTTLASTNSAALTIQSGDASGAGGRSGNVILDAGLSSGTEGTVSIGATNASAVIVGNTGSTTSLAGNTISGTAGNTLSLAGTTSSTLGSGSTTTTVTAGTTLNLNGATTTNLQALSTLNIATTSTSVGGDINVTTGGISSFLSTSGTISLLTGDTPTGLSTHAGDINLNVGKPGPPTLGSTTQGNINIGTNGNVGVITIGATNAFPTSAYTTTSSTLIQAGSQGINLNTTGSFNIGKTNTFIDNASYGVTSLAATVGANTGGAFSGAAGTTYYYKVVGSSGASGVDAPSSEASFSSSSFTPVSAPWVAPSGVNTASGVMPAGTYQYLVTFKTANGETTAGPAASVVLTASHKTTLTISAAAAGAPAAVTSVNIYRTTAGGSTFFLLTSSLNSSTCNSGNAALTLPVTTCIDNTLDSSLSATTLPGSNTATTNTNKINLTWTNTATANTYYIYRGTSSNGENVYYTTAGPTSYTDTNGASTGGSPGSNTTPTYGKLGIGTNAPTGDITFGGSAAKLINVVAGTTTGINMTLQAGAAGSGNNNGGNLIFQGGAGVGAGKSGGVVVQPLNDSTNGGAFQIQNVAGVALFAYDTSAKKITTAQADGASTIGFAFNTTVAYATAGAKLLSVQNNGTEKFAIDWNGHILTGGTAPSTLVAAAGAGSTATCTLSGGDDTAGTITITSSGSGQAAGLACTMTFASAYQTTAPRPVLTPTNANGASVQAYVGSSTTTLTINFGVAPTNGQSYTFNYHTLQ